MSKDPKISVDYPTLKHYAHYGKKRKNYEGAMVRCGFTDMISRTPLVCNHLLWRKNPDKLREHLCEHMQVDLVQKMTDYEVLQQYFDAERIFLPGIPEDDNDIDGESLDAELGAELGD